MKIQFKKNIALMFLTVRYARYVIGLAEFQGILFYIVAEEIPKNMFERKIIKFNIKSEFMT